MSLSADLSAEVLKLDPSSVIELYEIDATDLGGGVFRFHNGTNKLMQNLFWQGNEYTRFPLEAKGFEISAQGQFPRPTVAVSNALGTITAILLDYADLIGAKFTRKRTLLKFLDAVNFPGGVNPDADPGVYFPDDIFYVDRKSSEDRDQVVFELASTADLQGVKAPKRVVVKNTCPWIYRGPECNFTGIPLYDVNDNQIPAPTSPEGIAMMAAYQDLLDAQAALVTAQQDLVDAANAVTAAEQYTTTDQYSQSSPVYYVRVTQFGSTTAVWNDVSVSVGSTYSAGAFVETIGFANYYRIVEYTRDNVALAAAVATYDAAVITRDNAIADVATKQSDFDTALAAVPADDDLYTNDKCGKRLNSCKIRFGANNPLSFGGFPGVSR